MGHRGRNRRGRGPGPSSGKRTASLTLRSVGDNDYELVHPAYVKERYEDYLEGLEAWRAGAVEEARDVLRFALEGAGDNLWIHVALGKIALSADKDGTLARGHFGYAFELGQQALPQGFAGRLPRERPANQPFYDAIEGLITCDELLGRGDLARSLAALRDRLQG